MSSIVSKQNEKHQFADNVSCTASSGNRGRGLKIADSPPTFNRH